MMQVKHPPIFPLPGSVDTTFLRTLQYMHEKSTGGAQALLAPTTLSAFSEVVEMQCKRGARMQLLPAVCFMRWAAGPEARF